VYLALLLAVIGFFVYQRIDAPRVAREFDHAPGCAGARHARSDVPPCVMQPATIISMQSSRRNREDYTILNLVSAGKKWDAVEMRDYIHPISHHPVTVAIWRGSIAYVLIDRRWYETERNPDVVSEYTVFYFWPTIAWCPILGFMLFIFLCMIFAARQR
jgi:hypothetical protein